MLQKPANRFLKSVFIACFCVGLAANTRGLTMLSVPDPPRATLADIMIHVNQVAYDEAAPKFAVIETAVPLPADSHFLVIEKSMSKTVFTGTLGDAQECSDWFPGRFFYRADFSAFHGTGYFKLHIEPPGKSCCGRPRAL